MFDRSLLPAVPGTYILELYLPRKRKITIGSLGEAIFPAGQYLYCGSAHGAGGLQARLGRHLSGHGRVFWHIDYLRSVSQITGFGFCCENNRLMQLVADQPRVPINHQVPLECQLSQTLASLPGSWIPLPGFGSSDCKSRCPAHFVGLSRELHPNDFLETPSWLKDLNQSIRLTFFRWPRTT